jgi:hypothetical protein
MVLAARGGFTKQLDQCLFMSLSASGRSAAYIEAISAIESTTIAMPKQTTKNVQIAPAGPPLVRESAPVLRS